MKSRLDENWLRRLVLLIQQQPRYRPERGRWIYADLCDFCSSLLLQTLARQLPTACSSLKFRQTKTGVLSISVVCRKEGSSHQSYRQSLSDMTWCPDLVPVAPWSQWTPLSPDKQLSTNCLLITLPAFQTRILLSLDGNGSVGVSFLWTICLQIKTI